MSTSSLKANELKELGNRYFQAHRFQDAIHSYDKAINKNPQIAHYLTNRALCHLHLQQWHQASTDCQQALELDRLNVKAHFFLGRAAAQLEDRNAAIVHLTRANELARSQKLGYGDDIANQLRLVKRDKFRQEETVRLQQEVQLQTTLMHLIDEYEKRKLQSEAQDRPVNDQVPSLRDQVNTLFEQADDRRRRRDVPDFLCGRISFEIMTDPVITPSGITYDKADICEHLQRVGHFDPVTRASLTVEQLVPNLAMKEVITHFLAENPWAEHL